MLFALVASSLWIVNSIYSIGYMRANDEPRQTDVLCLLRRRARQHDRDRVRQEPVHAVPVLRGVDALDLSAGDAQAERGSRSRRPHLSSAPARHVAAAVPAGDHRHLGSCRHARFHAGRHPRRQGRRAGHRDPARALRFRHRQGGGDAAAFLAAGGDGGADAGQRVAARRGGGQGRRLHDPEGGGVHLRDRYISAPWASPPGLRPSRARP